MHLGHCFFAAGIALGVASCGSVPLTSVPALSRIDFRTTEFAALRAGLRLPDALRPQPNGVELEVTLRIDGSPDEKTIFPLVELPGGALPDSGQASKLDFIYRLSDQDSRRFDAIRDKTNVARQQNKRGSVDLSIAPKQFCLLRSLPEGPLPVTSYIQTSETRRFVVLTRELDLRSEVQTASSLPDLKPCKNG
jgi:hypothetical protein